MRGSGRAALAVAVLAFAVAPGAAQAATIGLADQNATAYADGRLRALKLPVARLVVPYDAATSQPQLVASWLAAVAAAGMQPHVAFEHLRANGCPGSPCIVPSRATYAAAVRRFVATFPQVRVYTTWNEANHESQPVASRPEMVAGYYEELRAACALCTIVAGDVLDSGSYLRWLERFQAATDSDPQLWGLHNYGDVTYGTTEGTDAVLRAVSGELWIEETGGIVVLRNSAGRITLSFDETRAAASIDRAFALLASRPRITRMYVYHWQSGATSRFDAGLVRPDCKPAPELRGDAARHRRPAVGGGLRAGGGEHRALERDVVEGLTVDAARARAVPDERRALRRSRPAEPAHPADERERHQHGEHRHAHVSHERDAAHGHAARARLADPAQAAAGRVGAEAASGSAPEHADGCRAHGDAEARQAALTSASRHSHEAAWNRLVTSRARVLLCRLWRGRSSWESSVIRRRARRR